MAKIRLYSLVVLSLVLVTLVTGGQQPQHLITDTALIGERLRTKLNESMALQSVTYTSFNSSQGLPYQASTTFHRKGMGRLYNYTNLFMDLIQPKQAYPEGRFIIYIFKVLISMRFSSITVYFYRILQLDPNPLFSPFFSCAHLYNADIECQVHLFLFLLLYSVGPLLKCVSYICTVIAHLDIIPWVHL